MMFGAMQYSRTCMERAAPESPQKLQHHASFRHRKILQVPLENGQATGTMPDNMPQMLLLIRIGGEAELSFPASEQIESRCWNMNHAADWDEGGLYTPQADLQRWHFPHIFTQSVVLRV